MTGQRTERNIEKEEEPSLGLFFGLPASIRGQSEDSYFTKGRNFLNQVHDMMHFGQEPE